MEKDEKAVFTINYQGIVFHCEVSMAVDGYMVSLDDAPAASIGLNDNATWEQRSGKPLPQDLIEKIGNKIEQHYE